MNRFNRLSFTTMFAACVIMVTQAWAGAINISARVQINGRYGVVAVYPDEEVSVEAFVNPSVPSEVWLAAVINSEDWWWFTPNGWIEWLPSPVMQEVSGPIFGTIYKGILGPGDYWVATGWDTLSNGQLDRGLLTYGFSRLRVLEDDPLQMAVDFLRDDMDQYHNRFWVYKDYFSPANHFHVYAAMGSGASMDNGVYWDVQRQSVIRASFSGEYWGGYYFQNGFLRDGDQGPRPNWGVIPDAGVDLTGATRISFLAKGEHGGEVVEFFAFGITGDYPDSSPKVSTGYVTLDSDWKRYEIDIHGLDLRYVLGGFGWGVSSVRNNHNPVTFYMDDISYDVPGLSTLRLLQSYRLPWNYLQGNVIHTAAYLYDNALAILAFLAEGSEDSIARARLLADALLYAKEHDRYFHDGRLRNGYMAGDLVLPPGWEPNGVEGAVRLPGIFSGGTWFEDSYSIGTSTGDTAWAMLALLSMYDLTKDPRYLNGAMELGDWVYGHTASDQGYTGGYAGATDQGLQMLTWKSTEHNLALYAAFKRLYDITGNIKWQEHSEKAKAFLDSMWETDRFSAGTTDLDVLDANSLAILALAPEEGCERYMDMFSRIEEDFGVSTSGFQGFDFNGDKDGIWWEGTAQMALAYSLCGLADKAQLYKDQLRSWQKKDVSKRAIIASLNPIGGQITTGMAQPPFIISLPHVGATAWFVFVERGYNPFWNRFISAQ